MVFLILTRTGLDDLGDQFGRLPANLWVNHSVLTCAEIQAYRDKGIAITNFTYDIPLNDRVAINEAIDTIAEHHPGEIIYTEWGSL